MATRPAPRARPAPAPRGATRRAGGPIDKPADRQRPTVAQARAASTKLAQADIHRRTRSAHALEVAEDYVEAIAELMEQNGEARVVDIARRLGVTHVTVTRTVSRLRASGLVIARPYRAIFLSSSGKSMAQRVRRRHEIVVAFLLALGLSDEAAHVDAEGIEHHVSRETLDAFERFVAAHR